MCTFPGIKLISIVWQNFFLSLVFDERSSVIRLRDVFLSTELHTEFTWILVFEIGKYFLEVCSAQRVKYFLLIRLRFANVTMLRCDLLNEFLHWADEEAFLSHFIDLLIIIFNNLNAMLIKLYIFKFISIFISPLNPHHILHHLTYYQSGHLTLFNSLFFSKIEIRKNMELWLNVQFIDAFSNNIIMLLNLINSWIMNLIHS